MVYFVYWKCDTNIVTCVISARHILLLGSVGRSLSSDGLETGLDGLNGTSGMTAHALQEEESGFLVQDRVRRATSVTCHILLDVPVNMYTYLSINIINSMYMTGVINDPLSQPTVPAGSDCRLILKFCYGRTDGRTLCVKTVIWVTMVAVVGLVDQQDLSRTMIQAQAPTKALAWKMV